MSGEITLAIIRLFVLLLGAAAAASLLMRRVGLPYTVGLVGVGLLAGLAVGPGALSATPFRGLEVTPQLVLVALLPGLIFEAAYHVDAAHLRAAIAPILLLAVPGVIAVAALVAVVLAVTVGLPIGIGFVVGAIVAATDPAAVIASFRRLGAPPGLRTLVEAESVLNDGTGIVLFAIAVGAIGRPIQPGEAILDFVGAVVLSGLLGAVIGALGTRLIVAVGDHLIELTMSILLAYGSYLLADGLHLSGVIATAAAGVVLGSYGPRVGLSVRTIEALDTVWEFIAFVLTALAFILLGLAIPLDRLAGAAVPIAWAVLAVLLGRAAIVYGGLGLMRRVLPLGSPPIPSAWLHVVVWSGLRGAVSVALALALPGDFPMRTLVQEITFGVVLVTLVLQATTIDRLLSRLGLVVGRPDLV